MMATSVISWSVVVVVLLVVGLLLFLAWTYESLDPIDEEDRGQ